MKHTENRFRGYGNLNLYYRYWLPEKEPKAILLVVHGLAEHSGRYMNVVNHLVPKGYAVYSFDQRGHGKSDGRRGYVERFSHYLDDLTTFFDIVRGEHRDAKIFMVGHSLGGMLAAAYAVNHQDELKGLVLSGTTIRFGNSVSPAMILAGRILSLLLPKVGVSVIDASAISRDETVVDAYVNDPLVYGGKISARLGVEFINMMQKLTGKMAQIYLPILIMHGTADRLSDPKGSEMLYERVSSKDKTLKLYEGFYHEIFNEPGREQVLADMENWLSAHL